MLVARGRAEAIDSNTAVSGMPTRQKINIYMLCQHGVLNECMLAYPLNKHPAKGPTRRRKVRRSCKGMQTSKLEPSQASPCPIEMDPEVGLERPANRCRRVVLPLPLLPCINPMLLAGRSRQALVSKAASAPALHSHSELAFSRAP